MKREMKHSGVAWIGEIPEHWEQGRLKNYFHLHGRIGWNGLRSEEFKESSYAYLVTGQDFVAKDIDWQRCYQIDKERYDEDEYIQLENGDILVSKDGTIGKVAIVSNLDKPACLNSGIFVVKQNTNNCYCSNYLYWLLVSHLLKTFNDFLNLGGTTIIHLYQHVFERMPLVLPPFEEQQKIAEFLDRKCGEIDEMISLQEKVIEELKAYKQSIITETVTKGLNPNVAMRDSEIEWIGEIPEHWEVKPLKWDFEIIAGATPKTDNIDFWDGNIPWVTPADYKTEDVYIEKGKRFLSEKGVESCVTTLLPKNSIIFSKRAPIGLVVVNSQPLCTNQGCLGCIPKKDIVKYFYYVISVFTEQYELYGSGTTFKEISANNFANFKLPFPNATEQRQIADYLDRKCAEIDELVAVKQQKIETLKEYKKSLIYEYVTGKKEI